MLKPLALLLSLGVAHAGPVSNLTDPVNAAQINMVISGVNTNAQLLGVYGKKLDSVLTLLSATREDLKTLKAENAALKAQVAQLEAAAKGSAEQVIALEKGLELAKKGHGEAADAQKAALEALSAELNSKLTTVHTEAVKKGLFLEHQGKELKKHQAQQVEMIAKVNENLKSMDQGVKKALERFDGGVKQAFSNVDGNISKLQGAVNNLKQNQGQLQQGFTKAMEGMQAFEQRSVEFQETAKQEGEALVEQVKAFAALPKLVEAAQSKLVEVDVSAKQRHEKLMAEVQRVDGAGQKRGEKLNKLEVTLQQVQSKLSPNQK